jgi:EAL domain-containing protein (putative c-di-GMP-specific phosphodiesterase class I)
VRWYHPDHGIIKPDRFIPLAERSGLINDLGRLVLAKGIRTLAEWQSNRETAHLRLAVNVSVKSFASPEFVPHIEALIAEHNVDASRLMLEFTEHVMSENQQATAERMRHLKQIGIAFSLDDFGTGYSSLAYLRQLPFDEVKIDGSFVTDIETKESDRALVRTILAMAETLGLSAVAEHVETARQEAFLLSFGCEIFQGYLYAPPLQPSDFVARARMPAPLARTAEIMRRSA